MKWLRGRKERFMGVLGAEKCFKLFFSRQWRSEKFEEEIV